MAKLTTKKKPYIKQFTIRIGALSMQGKMFGIQKSRKDTEKQYVFVTPDGKPVSQAYVDEDGKQYTQAELEKATRTDDGELVLVGKENIAAARASTLPANVLDLTVHDATQVDTSLYPAAASAYVFEPSTDDPANVKWASLLLAILQRSDKAFVGMCNFHGHEGVFRVSVWRGNIVIQKQLYSDALLEVEVPEYNPVATSTISKGLEMVNKLTKPFDADAYRNTQFERLSQMETNVLSGEPVTVTTATPVNEVDLDDLLDAFVSSGMEA